MTNIMSCGRCGRSISIHDDEATAWEPLDETGDDVVVCQACLTPAELQAIAEADAALMDTIALEDPSDPRGDPL